MLSEYSCSHRVYGLEQRRQAYLSRLRTQFVTRLGIRTEQLMRENEQRRESVRRTTYGRVEDCIQWIRSRLVSYFIICIKLHS